MFSPRWSIRSPSSVTRLLFFLLLSGALMMLDYQGHYLQTMRAGLRGLLYPLEWLATLPVRATAGTLDFFRGRASISRDYEQLRAEHQLLLSKLQRYEALEADNLQLRQLLGAATRVTDRAMIVELLEVSPEPFTRKIVLAKGGATGLYQGQPVIDGYGVVGQITEVGTFTSRATLITDPSHAIPVQVVRNGLRAIIFGTGAHNEVEIPYLTAAADVRIGDVVVSSGIGGIFPPGYPVAQVTKIVNDPNEAFLKILARPAARLNHGKEVMVIWPGGQKAAADKPLGDAGRGGKTEGKK